MAKSMKLNSGSDSNNIQIAGNASFGISATEARQIAIDVFKANFYEFSEIAGRKALERAEEMTDNFIENFYAKIPHLEGKLQEPSVQSTMFKAQKEYAITGDKDLKEQLLDILIQRIDSEERSLKQIVLDEAITIIPKLTQDQINILTLIFSAVYYNHRGIDDLNSFFNYMNIKILYFYPDNEASYSFFTHLQFTGCCTLLSEGSTYKPFEQIIANRYKALFIKGFTEQDYLTEFGEDSSMLRPLLIRCMQNPTAFQFNALNDEVFKSQKEELNLGSVSDKAIAFQNKFLMSDNEIVELLISKNNLFENFIENWKETEIKTIRPTSVGFAIAVLNYNRVTGENILVESFL